MDRSMSMRTLARGLLVLSLLLGVGAAPGFAQSSSDEELDDVLGGFDEDEEEFVDREAEAEFDPELEEPSFWDLTGSLSLGTTYNLHQNFSGGGTYYGNLSRLRPKLSLQLDLDLPLDWSFRASGYGFYDFAYLAHGRSQYTDQVIDDYEWDAQLQDLYLQGSLLEDLDLKVGRQVVNWGRSDTLRVVDVISPLDNREPGLVDLEDLRRGVGMARLDYYLGSWSFTGLVIPEVRFDQNPDFGSDFYPDIGVDPAELAELIKIKPKPITKLIDPRGFLPGELPSIGDIPEDRPDHFGERPEWGAVVSGIFSGWDLSFYAAQYYQNTGRVALVPGSLPIPTVVEFGPPLPPLPPVELILDAGFVPELHFSRLTMVGAGANFTFGSWLVKGEWAYLDGLDFDVVRRLVVTVDPFADPPATLSPRVRSLEKSRWDLMGGIEYYGFTDTNIALEVANRHIHNFDSELRGFPNFAQRNALESALRVTMNFLRERLEVTLLGVAFGEKAQDGSFVRLSADYELGEGLEVGGGLLLFQSGDLVQLSQVGRNDRLFLTLKYSF
jgi:hypothetical protein